MGIEVKYFAHVRRAEKVVVIMGKQRKIFAQS
jgi:hypothetical protein